MSVQTAQAALRGGAARLTAAGIAGAGGDARALLAHAMEIAPDRLTLHLPDVLTPAAQARFEVYINARARAQPVAQIIGKRQFWGRSFIVTPDTLDPRPETETLIAAALRAPFASVLDLGTGTGCIMLTLLAEAAQAIGTGADISRAALAVAQQNAAALGLGARAQFVHSDWFAAVQGRFDLIVSNPPYIAAAEMTDLAPDVRDWEPHLALTPGGDGLGAYRILAAGAGQHLTAKGRILLEIGPTQGAAVQGLLAAHGFKDVQILPDFDGRDRVICASGP